MAESNGRRDGGRGVSWAKDLQTLEGNTGPTPANTEWDYVLFAGEVCPGVARVSANAPSDLDRQKPKGQKKTFTVDNGDPPIKFEIDILLQPSEMEEFRDFIIPILRPKSKTGGREPLSFEHPLAEFWNVPSIIVDEIRTPHPESGGLMRVRISAQEWTDAPSPPIKTTGKVQDSKGKNSKEVSSVPEQFDVNPEEFLRGGL